MPYLSFQWEECIYTMHDPQKWMLDLRELQASGKRRLTRSLTLPWDVLMAQSYAKWSAFTSSTQLSPAIWGSAKKNWASIINEFKILLPIAIKMSTQSWFEIPCMHSWFEKDWDCKISVKICTHLSNHFPNQFLYAKLHELHNWNFRIFKKKKKWQICNDRLEKLPLHNDSFSLAPKSGSDMWRFM